VDRVGAVMKGEGVVGDGESEESESESEWRGSAIEGSEEWPVLKRRRLRWVRRCAIERCVCRLYGLRKSAAEDSARCDVRRVREG